MSFAATQMHADTPRPRVARTVAVVQLVTAAAFIAVAAHFFATGSGQTSSEVYRAFELSIWVPDLLVAMPSLVVAGVVTWRRRTLRHPSNLICAGALLFLGILDVSFSTRFGDSYPSPADRAFVLVSGLYFVALGATLAAVGRYRRD